MGTQPELARLQGDEADAAFGHDGHRSRQCRAQYRWRDHGDRRSGLIRGDELGQMLQPFLGMTFGIGFEDQYFARWWRVTCRLQGHRDGAWGAAGWVGRAWSTNAGPQLPFACPRRTGRRRSIGDTAWTPRATSRYRLHRPVRRQSASGLRAQLPASYDPSGPRTPPSPRGATATSRRP